MRMLVMLHAHLGVGESVQDSRYQALVTWYLNFLAVFLGDRGGFPAHVLLHLVLCDAASFSLLPAAASKCSSYISAITSRGSSHPL